MHTMKALGLAVPLILSLALLGCGGDADTPLSG